MTEHGLFNLIDIHCMERSHVCMYDYVYHILLCVMTRPSSSFVDYPTFVRTQMSKRGVVKRIRYRAMMFYREILLYAICFADAFIVICR